MIPWKRSWPDLAEDLPVDVLPCSNGEFLPKPPTAEQRAIMELANSESERLRRKIGLSRRDFVRSAAAFTVGFWAIQQVAGGKFGSYAGAHNTNTTNACDLEWAGHTGLESLNNLPGEFIFDIQSHHVESDGMWRVTNPAFEAFFAAIWGQAGPITGGKPGVRSDGSVRGGGAGELDPIENLSRYHYLKELFLDSATSMTVLSAVPAAPDITQPLPIDRAALTVATVNNLANSQRTVMHAFVMPNRGSGGGTPSALGGGKPVYMEREFEIMEERAHTYKDYLRGWKTYPAWGDVPYASGWFFDDPVGQAFIEQVDRLSDKIPTMPKNIATHKGFALPGFDQRAASPRDIGPAAKANPRVNFIVYHSGYDGDVQKNYAGDDKVSSADRTVDSLIKSLRENGLIAKKFAEPGKVFGNIPNVYAEIGSTWRSVMGSPDQSAHLLGKLINHVGPKRICWGTDSLWFGSPHSEIIGLRKFEFTQAGKDLYGLPYGLEGDAEDPTQPAPSPDRTIRNAIFGRNAARVYKVDADAARNKIACDDVQKIRDGYILNQMTPREMTPMSTNTLFGARTPAELLKQRAGSPWGP